MERGNGRWTLNPRHAAPIFGVCATDFQNGNFYEANCPASATDKSALDKAILNLKALRDHFRQRIAVKQACNAKPAIAYLMKDATARPA